MNRRFSTVKSSIVSLAALLAVSAGAFAKDSDPPVVVASPSPWTTLRSDSVEVSIQADTSKLPRKSIDFKVVKRSGARSSTLFTKSVKMDDVSVDVFLGRAREVPLGGSDYLAIEWSVPGSELSGVIEPIGVAKLNGQVVDKKWVPAQPPMAAAKLKDGATEEQVAAALAGSAGAFEVGGMKMAAGWNKEALFIHFTPAEGITGVEFAFDLKCGKNAFLAWADRFVAYAADGDSVSGLHYGNRSVDKEGMKFEDMAWGEVRGRSPAMTKAGEARLVKVGWSDLGMQPFDERNIGFSVFVNGKVKKQPAFYPSAAKRNIPGTWGDLRLEK